jgi:hypothetical protein
VNVIDDLKKKMLAISSEITAMRDQIAVLENQKAAFETVIRTYEPGFTDVALPPRRGRKSKDSSTMAAVTALLQNKNNRHVVLDILRRCDHQMTSAEIADVFTSDEGLGEDHGRQTALASRFSGTLNGLMNQGLVKKIEADGKRFLWEIAR